VLSPSDIESFSILKDAAAAAVYKELIILVLGIFTKSSPLTLDIELVNLFTELFPYPTTTTSRR